MPEVTLNEILASREERVKRQKELIDKYKCPLVYFTMNIAGPVKTNTLIEKAFYEGVERIKSALQDKMILYQDAFVKHTGCEAVFSVKDDANSLKKLCVEIEQSNRIGRLYDIDIIDTNGKKIERATERNCIVCGSHGRGCAAGRIHSVSELQSITKEIILTHFLKKMKETCSSLAVKSLLDEVYTTPKPGLVDRRNNGSHKDMNVVLFEKSALSLKTYFEQCFSVGYETCTSDYNTTFSVLRRLGLEAESKMFSVTDGVNTHKGIIYSIGVLCGAIGRLWKPENSFPEISDICYESAKIVEKSVVDDFAEIDSSTAGGKLYLKYGLTGIRGEVASGFQSVLKISLPVYEKLLSEKYNLNDAGTITLLHLISAVKDTNIFHRGGIEGAAFATKSACEILKNSDITHSQIHSLDDEFIKRNISPGGCADLLAVTYFLHGLKSL